MTAQRPEKLRNAHPDVSLEGLRLYAVVCLDSAGSKVRHPDTAPEEIPEEAYQRKRSDLYRHYVASYRLEASGQLKLLSFSFPTADKGNRSLKVNRYIEGDFWLGLRESFFGKKRAFVPFVDGLVVTDKTKWQRGRKLNARSKR